MTTTKYAGRVYLNGRLLFARKITLASEHPPDVATFRLIRRAEETLDRRILGDIHQMTGLTVFIEVKKLSNQ